MCDMYTCVTHISGRFRWSLLLPWKTMEAWHHSNAPGRNGKRRNDMPHGNLNVEHCTVTPHSAGAPLRASAATAATASAVAAAAGNGLCQHSSACGCSSTVTPQPQLWHHPRPPPPPISFRIGACAAGQGDITQAPNRTPSLGSCCRHALAAPLFCHLRDTRTHPWPFQSMHDGLSRASIVPCHTKTEHTRSPQTQEIQSHARSETCAIRRLRPFFQQQQQLHKCAPVGAVFSSLQMA